MFGRDKMVIVSLDDIGLFERMKEGGGLLWSVAILAGVVREKFGW